ncbi:hypothetical protein OG548_14300 [Streptomyces sp. NBC_01356]|uniref:hypothetical protein n=1 Tax=Streptomyces sp. NBC_01356 TaxID=2903836 RepID=UPI002E32E1C1|nr:hypothetical protein [Streptomyces sp. NBC_01356]
MTYGSSEHTRLGKSRAPAIARAERRRSREVTACTVTSCGRTLGDDEPHWKVCGRCEHRIRGWLRELPRQLPLLRASLRPDSGPTQSAIHGGRAHAPLPVRGDVLALLGPAAPGPVHDPEGDQAGPVPIHAVIRTWAELLADERGKPLPLLRPGETYGSYLAAHLPYALTRPWIADLHQELGELISRIRNITCTEPRRRPKTAPCPDCGAFGLMEEDWQAYIDCEVCGLLLTPAEYTDHAERVMPGLYRTALLIVTHEKTGGTHREGH